MSPDDLIILTLAAIVAAGVLREVVGWIRWRWGVWKLSRMSSEQRRASIDGITPPGFDVLPSTNAREVNRPAQS